MQKLVLPRIYGETMEKYLTQESPIIPHYL